MNTLKRTLALLGALVIASASFVGCSDDASSSGSASSTTAASTSAGETTAAGETTSAAPAEAKITLPDTGDKLTIVTWTLNDLNPQLELFKAKYNVTDDQVTYALVGDSGTTARDGYEAYFLGDGDCDIYCAEAGWILQYINQDKYSAPLADIGITAADYADAYSYTVAIGTDKNGVLKGASYQAAGGGYAYRADLAETYLGAKTPEEMQAKVADWDKFMTAAETVSTASDGKTAMAATIAGIWQVYQSNRTKAWVDGDMKIDLENCEAFAEMMKTMYDKGYVTKVGQWTPEWAAIGNDNSTMGYFFSTWCLTNAEGGQLMGAEGGVDGAAYGKYNLCVGPTNYYWGGTWFVVHPDCDNGTLANQFIKYFTADEEGCKAYAEKTGDFCNNQKAMDAIIAAGTNKNPLLNGQDQYAILADSAKNIKMDGIITEYDQKIKDCFIEAITEYVVDGKTSSVADTIEAFKDKVISAAPDVVVD